MSIRVAVVEDTTGDRESVQRLLTDAPGFVCVAAVSTGEAALEAIPAAAPDVVLMDIHLPGMSGIECVGRLVDLGVKAQFMMLTVFADHERIALALSAGATGYLLKSEPAGEILEAIRVLHHGGAPMSGQIARRVTQMFRRPDKLAQTLSPAERQVLRLLAQGLLYKEVADQLGIQVATVRTHVWHIYGKLHVHTRTEAINKGLGGLRWGET